MWHLLRAKARKPFRYSLHSWSFYQPQRMIEYKARLLGVPVEYIDPQNTSKVCSRCRAASNRNGKEFKCLECGHVDRADVNVAFHIATHRSIGQSMADRDVIEGSASTPKGQW